MLSQILSVLKTYVANPFRNFSKILPMEPQPILIEIIVITFYLFQISTYYMYSFKNCCNCCFAHAKPSAAPIIDATTNESIIFIMIFKTFTSPDCIFSNTAKLITSDNTLLNADSSDRIVVVFSRRRNCFTMGITTATAVRSKT